MSTCVQCGRESSEEARFCSDCGISLWPERQMAVDSPVSQDSSDDVSNQIHSLLLLCAEQVEACQDIERELKNGYIIMRKAVEGEIKWGGLIFSPEDIFKTLGRFQRYFNNMVVEQAEPLNISNRSMHITTLLIQLQDERQDGNPEVEKVEDRAREASECAERLSQQIASTSTWLDEFYVALCNTGTARALLPLLPPFAWEDKEPSKVGLKSRSFLDFFLGRD